MGVTDPAYWASLGRGLRPEIGDTSTWCRSGPWSMVPSFYKGINA
jgi:hypothetical protein